MKEKANQDIRKEIQQQGLNYWQVAEQIGITASTFTVWLRTPLTDERRQRTEKALKELKELKE